MRIPSKGDAIACSSVWGGWPSSATTSQHVLHNTTVLVTNNSTCPPPHTQHTLRHKCVTSYVRDGVEGSVCPNAQVRAGNIVGNSGRNHHHGNAKLFVFRASCLQLHEPQICLRSEQGLVGHWPERWGVIKGERGREPCPRWWTLHDITWEWENTIDISLSESRLLICYSMKWQKCDIALGGNELVNRRRGFWVVWHRTYGPLCLT